MSSHIDAADHRTEAKRQYPWTGTTWTYEKVGWFWPTSSRLLVVPLERIKEEYTRALLETTKCAGDEAYECLRLARWGENTGLRAICPRCGERAWSYDPKGPIHWWRCVTEAMYRQHQRKKGYVTEGTSRKGCGHKFRDVEGTPFKGAPVPLGLVFLSLYFSPKRIERLLLEYGEGATAVALSQVLKDLRQKQHAGLKQRMRRFAKLFCGRILLEYHPELVSSSGHTRVVNNLTRVATGGAFIHAISQPKISDLKARHRTIQSLLGKLLRVETAFLQGRRVDQARRADMCQALILEVSRLTDVSPLHN